MVKSEPVLWDRHILVVEDEYLLADEMCAELECEGAVVVGPAGHLEDAIDLIASGRRIDGAILDVNLGGELVFPAAVLLLERGIPMVFTTGFDASIFPSRFGDIVRCEKPVVVKTVIQAIDHAIGLVPVQMGRRSRSDAE